MVGRYRNFKNKKMKTRTDLLNHLAEKYNLQNYLEIGVQVKALNFDKIICKYKISVDPDENAKADFVLTSDEYFEDFPKTKFDLVFIDGMHTSEQVKKDWINASMCLSNNGIIVFHDCSPETYERTIVPRPTPRGSWNGDVYKFVIGLQHKYTVDIDNGCTVWHSVVNDVVHKPIECTWEDFDKNRKELLNLISWDEFISLNPHV
jgi:hypothetical protein